MPSTVQRSQGSIAKQKKLIAELVEENCDEINGFLKNAGYHYKVKLIEDKEGQHRLKLIHNDVTDEVNNAKNHLSFGERNAFSLVLFMYHALKESPDLIVLDDPISSFDKNKKYAIVDMLFRKGNKSFSGKTVLLLTHDFEPIVDMIYQHTDKFPKPIATFLENYNGILSEKEFNKSEIKTFLDINRENSNQSLHVLNKLVYLRRYYEIIDNKDFAYHVVSNLFHKRDIPTLNENGVERDMMPHEISSGCERIKIDIADFSYQDLLDLVKDDITMKKLYLTATNNYEKLHIYRIIFADKSVGQESHIIKKFINEAFHIENNSIYQLNPSKYQLVPQYVIDECTKFVELLDY